MENCFEKTSRAALLGATLLAAGGGCDVSEPTDDNFYLDQDGYDVTCGEVRNTNPPWLSPDYCDDSMSDQTVVKVGPFAYQQEARKKLKAFLECVFSPIPFITFTDTKPSSAFNTVFWGGRAAPCSDSSCFIGGETRLDTGNVSQQDIIYVIDRNSSGKVKSLASIANDTVHEISHALGLDHSADPNSFMYPEYLEGSRWNFTPNEAEILLENTMRRDDYGERIPDLTNIPVRCHKEIDAVKAEPAPSDR
jgi:hypothetical protein